MNFINGEPTSGYLYKGFFNLNEVMRRSKQAPDAKRQTFSVKPSGRGFIVCRILFPVRGLPEEHEIMGFLREQDADSYAATLLARVK